VIEIRDKDMVEKKLLKGLYGLNIGHIVGNSLVVRLNGLSLIRKTEDRLHLGNKNEQVHFILLSVCAIFDPKNRR